VEGDEHRRGVGTKKERNTAIIEEGLEVPSMRAKRAIQRRQKKRTTGKKRPKRGFSSIAAPEARTGATKQKRKTFFTIKLEKQGEMHIEQKGIPFSAERITAAGSTDWKLENLSGEESRANSCSLVA